MEKLDLKTVKKKGITIVEDAAHALGAKYKNGKKVGCCCFSDMTVFSFHPVKLIAAGEGGIITTNSREYYEKLISLRTHGISQNNKFISSKNSKEGPLRAPWYYEMQNLGFHYRITDIQCALALSQLKKINFFLNKRKKIANYYDLKFKNFENCKAFQLKELRKFSANHLYVLEIDFNKIKKNRSQVILDLRKRKIYTQVHYIPIFMHPFYSKKYKKNKNLKNTFFYYKKALSIPIYYSLSQKDQDYVVACIKKIIG